MCGRNVSPLYMLYIEKGNVIKLLCSFCRLVCEISSMRLPVQTPEGNPACELFASRVGSEQVLSEELRGQRDHVCA